MLQILNVSLEGVEFGLIDHSQFAPRLHLSTIATHGNTALSRLHGVGIEIGRVGQTTQGMPLLHALLQQRHGSIEVFYVFRPLVAQHLFSSLHLPAECHSKHVVALYIVPHTTELISMLCGCCPHGQRHLLHGIPSVTDTLVDNIQWQLTGMFFTIVFFLDVLNEFFTLRTTALVEARIDGELIGVDQLRHRHTEQQRLSIPFRDAETAQQLGSYLARLIVGIQQMLCSNSVDTIIFSQLLLPIRFVITTLVVPCIASPRLIPHPVTVQLLQAFAIGQLVCRIRPVPIRCLRIEVQAFGVVHTMHGLNSLLNKGWRRPAPRLQIGQDMYVVNMHRCGLGQLAMCLAPWATRLISSKALARIFRHRIDIGI